MRSAVSAALVLTMLGCAGATPMPAPATGLPVPASATCADTGEDTDQDGLDDRCELALAQAFAPELVVDARDCLWMADAGPARLGGGYLFAAQRTSAGVRIAYLPAYFRDCGWSGPVCVLRGGSCGAHAGDSELIVVDVSPADAAGRWRTTGVFLSAHCLGRSDGRCRWYRGEALRTFDWADDVTGGAPRVWVARGKHAHYPTRRDCDRGHWLYDSCDGNRAVARFPVHGATQNAGSRRHPLLDGAGCLTSDALPLGAAGTSPGTRECVWDASRPFLGWQAAVSGSAPTSYARYLERFAGF